MPLAEYRAKPWPKEARIASMVPHLIGEQYGFVTSGEVMRGAPLKTVQELLGHGSIAMTLRYVHLTTASKRDAVALLDETSNNDIARTQGESRT